MNIEIKEKQLYYVSIPAKWIGVCAGFDTELQGYHRSIKTDNGWSLSAFFGSDNVWSGMGVVVDASHKDFQEDCVFGCYEDGLYSTSKELLELFIDCFPPYDSD